MKILKLIKSLKEEFVWICSKCNHENDQDQNECNKCGEPDSGDTPFFPKSK